jgi:hypothetical protein
LLPMLSPQGRSGLSNNRFYELTVERLAPIAR